MAKKKRKSRKGARRGGSQRAKFKAASASCRRKIGASGLPAFSPASWKAFGSCMKREL